MQKRQIRMQDGCHLIFYTFEDEPAHRAKEQPDGNLEQPLAHHEKIGRCLFINDTLAEEKAAELRERVTPVAWGGEK
jgi:hypothetical protein